MNAKTGYQKYFEFRKVNAATYEVFSLSLYIKSILTKVSKTEGILDFSCGFGRLAGALIQEGYRNVEDLDVASEAIFVA